MMKKLTIDQKGLENLDNNIDEVKTAPPLVHELQGTKTPSINVKKSDLKKEPVDVKKTREDNIKKSIKKNKDIQRQEHEK